MSRGFIDGEYQDGELRGIDFLVGMRGFGKTTETARLLQQCTGGVNFFDPLSKHAELFPGAQIITDTDDLISYLRVNRGRRFRIVYQPRKGDMTVHFRKWCGVVFTFGWQIIAIDEVDKFCGPKWGPKWMPQELANLVDYGRHARVSMLVSARRPQNVAEAIKSECSWRVFRLKRKALDSLCEEVGDEHRAQIAGLQKFYYLRFVQDDDPVLCGGPRGIL